MARKVPNVPGPVMTGSSGEQWLITSAAVVGGTYALLRWKGKTQTSIGTFVMSWGTVFFILAMVTEASPKFGGAFALLVMTSDVLANGPALAQIVKDAQSGKPAAKPAKGAPAAVLAPAGHLSASPPVALPPSRFVSGHGHVA